MPVVRLAVFNRLLRQAKLMNRKKQKPYWKMNLEELREATKEYDKPIPMSKTRPLSKAQREWFERARRGPSVSLFVTEHHNVVLANVDADILNRALKYAHKQRLTLNDVVNRALKSFLARVK